MDIQNYGLTFVGFCVLGYALVRLLVWVVPRKLRSENKLQRGELLKAATHKGQSIKAEAVSRDKHRHQMLLEELDDTIKDHKEDLVVEEEDVKAQERFCDSEESRLKHLEKELDGIKNRVGGQQKTFEAKKETFTKVEQELRAALQSTSKTEATAVRDQIKQSLIESRQLECQKILKTVSDEINASSKRLASRMLARTMSRYAPEFPWPKAINFVDIDQKTFDTLSNPEEKLIPDIKQLAEIEAELLPGHNGAPPIIKLAGGSGILREAARLALTEVATKGAPHWTRIASVYEKHRLALLQTALMMGKRAVEDLQIDSMHPEILKLIGSLNWRTSYRQNQYLHTVEVAKLAGILANELGVDPDLAKRSGLLHDIGKCLDYKIEGSHAVISGDYADRFGESRLVCDTVMSHHNDLVLDTALSFVLKSADTLSGARPGARVNLEEGYQDRLSGIDDVVRSFPGVARLVIMNGGREVHVEVHHKKIHDADLESLTNAIAKKIEKDVAFPGQIKVMVTRRFEAVSVA